MRELRRALSRGKSRRVDLFIPFTPSGPTLNLGTTYHDVVFLCPSLFSSLLLKPIKCQNYVANEAKYIGLWHVHTPPGP